MGVKRPRPTRFMPFIRYIEETCTKFETNPTIQSIQYLLMVISDDNKTYRIRLELPQTNEGHEVYVTANQLLCLPMVVYSTIVRLLD